jgi:RNA polymerase sigma-70 factor (ECF subfamily)
VERFKTKVFHIAFSMMRNETQAEDMTQETFIRIWKGLPSYQGDASFSTWIYAITRNTCLTELKKLANRPTFSIHELETENSENMVAELHSYDRPTGQSMDLDFILAQLPEKYRRVLALYYLEDKSYDEVAVMLGIPLGTVRIHLHRAKKELLKFVHKHQFHSQEIAHETH